MPVCFVHRRRDRPDRAIAERPVIHACQRHHAATRSRQEYLVRFHELGKWEGPDFHIHAACLPHLYDSAPADAFERAPVRCDQLVAADREHIETGAFCNLAFGIEKDDSLVAIVLGLEQPGGEIAPVIVLHARVHTGRRNTCHRLGDPGRARSGGISGRIR